MTNSNTTITNQGHQIDLHKYDLIIVNSSAGKDSLCALFEVCRLADQVNFPKEKIVVSHQDLGKMEWKGTKELVEKQSNIFGLKTYYSKYRNRSGEELTLLDYVENRGKWMSRNQRFCTSEFKRSPGGRIVTQLTKPLGQCQILYVFGFRSQESPARAKKQVLSLNKRLTSKKRTVMEWNPILDWSEEKVWSTIRSNDLPYHPAYDLGMPRLSCCFCIFASFNALMIAGQHNPELLEAYCETERKIDHQFNQKFAIQDVQKAIQAGQQVSEIENWNM